MAFSASLQLSSYINRVAAMILRVLLFEAVESASHSFICKMAISLVEGLSKNVANNLIASKPEKRGKKYGQGSIRSSGLGGNGLPTAVLGTSDKIM